MQTIHGEKKRNVNATCSDLTCINSVSAFAGTATGSHPSLLVGTDAKICNDENAASASVTFEIHPFYDYFVFFYFPGLEISNNIEPIPFTFQTSMSPIDSPENDFQNSVKDNSFSFTGPQTFQGTLTKATVDAVPICPSTYNQYYNNNINTEDPPLQAMVGVWYRGFTGVSGPTQVDLCSTSGGSPRLHVYREEGGSLKCLEKQPDDREDYCKLTFDAVASTGLTSNPDEDYLFFVYEYATEEANYVGDFTFSINGTSTTSSASASTSSVTTTMMMMMSTTMLVFVFALW